MSTVTLAKNHSGPPHTGGSQGPCQPPRNSVVQIAEMASMEKVEATICKNDSLPVGPQIFQDSLEIFFLFNLFLHLNLLSTYSKPTRLNGISQFMILNCRLFAEVANISRPCLILVFKE